MCRLILIPLLMLAACGKTPEAHEKPTDPAIADALADPVMADPLLALQRDAGAVGVPVGATPEMAEGLPALGDLAKMRVRDAAFAGCDPRIGYGFVWMARLPADLALPNAAQVTEAAGSDAPKCALRIVRYGIAQSPASVAARWRKIGTSAGYAMSGDDASLRGHRTRDGAAFWAKIQPTKDGASVDLTVNRGG